MGLGSAETAWHLLAVAVSSPRDREPPERPAGTLTRRTPSTHQEKTAMAKSRGDFSEILIRRQVLSPDQLQEAKAIQQREGSKLGDTLVKLGYATPDQVMTAIAEFHGLQFIDLTEVTIPPAVVELVPESVARENVVLPLAQDNGS